MGKIGVIVEGVEDGYDEKALRVLIRRIMPDPPEVIVRPCGGNPQLMKKFPGHLEHFRYRGDITRALVIRDADGKCPVELRARMEAVIATRPK